MVFNLNNPIPLVAFVFNWLGFFAAYCLTKTVPGGMEQYLALGCQL